MRQARVWAGAIALLALMGAPAAAEEGGAWRQKASAFDVARLEGQEDAWRTALAGAARPGAAEVRRLAEGLWLAEPRSFAAQDLVGSYRCRVLKLGGLGDTVYGWMKCAITGTGSLLTFRKTSGSQQVMGRLYRDSDTAMVLLGVGYIQGDAIPAYSKADPRPGESCNEYHNEVALLRKVDERRFVLGFPRPLCESHFDVLELEKLPQER